MIRPVFLLLLFTWTWTLFSCRSGVQVNENPSPRFNPMVSAIQFYRGPLNHLSAVRYGECPMYPSDSEYGLQSSKKHGWVVGWVMAMDRLLRCGRDETRRSPPVRVDGKWKTYDPIENNDFWWYPPASSGQ